VAQRHCSSAGQNSKRRGGCGRSITHTRGKGPGGARPISNGVGLVKSAGAKNSFAKFSNTFSIQLKTYEFENAKHPLPCIQKFPTLAC
jgi:hypothetical protein